MQDKTDVVFQIECNLTATENTRTESIEVKLAISYDNLGDSFTDINSITKDQAIQWINNNISESALEDFKSQLSHRFIFTKIKIS